MRRAYRKNLCNLDVLSEKLQRSKNAIGIRAVRLGLDGRNWTTEEDKRIRQCYADYGAEYCRRFMKHRTLVAIQCRARKLGVKRDRSKLRCELPRGDVVKAMEQWLYGKK